MISVPKVQVSQDLKNADIFLSFYNENKKYNSKDYFEELNKHKKSIKYKLGISLKVKYMPKIKFILDEDYEYYDKINRMLKNDK